MIYSDRIKKHGYDDFADKEIAVRAQLYLALSIMPIDPLFTF